MEYSDRVRAHTDEHINAQIDEQTDDQIAEYRDRSPIEIMDRMTELDKQWDMERWLETNASIFALTGLVLGALVNRKWLILTGVVLLFLLQHAAQGWCPPVALFRRLGVRTRKEIERERCALQMLYRQKIGV